MARARLHGPTNMPSAVVLLRVFQLSPRVVAVGRDPRTGEWWVETLANPRREAMDARAWHYGENLEAAEAKAVAYLADGAARQGGLL